MIDSIEGEKQVFHFNSCRSCVGRRVVNRKPRSKPTNESKTRFHRGLYRRTGETRTSERVKSYTEKKILPEEIGKEMALMWTRVFDECCLCSALILAFKIQTWKGPTPRQAWAAIGGHNEDFPLQEAQFTYKSIGS